MNGFLDDPSAPNIGIGQGEAQVLRPVKSFDWEKLFNNVRVNNALKEREQEKNAALLTDDIQTQWATDNESYFKPKVEDWRNRIKTRMQETGGKIDPYERAKFINEGKQLKGEAEINSTLFKNYREKVKKLDDDKGKEYDWENSVKQLQIWNNPDIVPEFKEDIQKNYGGNINKWRAANEHNFQLVPNYNFEKVISDVVKDENVADYTENDSKTGKPKEYKYDNGRTYIKKGQKFLPTQVEVLTSSLWDDNNFKSKKTKEHALNYVNNTLTVTPSGIVAYPDGLSEGEQIIAEKTAKYAGDLKGLTQEEAKRRLAKGYLSAIIDVKGDKGVQHLTIAEMPRSTNSTPKETTTIATHYDNIAQQVQQNPNLSPEQVAQAFGGTVEVNPRTGTFDVNLPIPPTVKPFVTLPIASTLTLKGHNYTTNKGAEGQVAGTVAGNKLTWKKGGVTVTPNTPGAEAYGQVLYNPVKVDPKDDAQVATGFSLFSKQPGNENVTKEAYKQMLENGEKVGKEFKAEYNLSDPVQRTFYDGVLGGPTISQGAFNKEVKASKGSKPVSKPIGKSNDPLGLF